MSPRQADSPHDLTAWTPAAVVFDCDGLLVDTEPCWTVVGHSARPMPGAAELVRAVAQRVPVAVASNSPRGLLDAALRRAGLTDALPNSVAADEVQAAKPAPDLYLAACSALQTPPVRCLAFEDSLTGLRSAIAAGLRTVGVPTLRNGDFPADIVFGSLQDERLLVWVENW